MGSGRILVGIMVAVTLAASACSADDAATDVGAPVTGTADTGGGSSPEATHTSQADGGAGSEDGAGSSPPATHRSTGSLPPPPVADGPPPPTPGGCQTVETGVNEFRTTAGGPAVRVRLLLPASFEGDPLPAVLNFHGLGSSGVQQALLTGYEDLAGDEGFVAVHPTGADASWELAQFDVPGRDDLAMVDDLIDRIVTEFCVDPTRIYATGMSNGGFFTSLLVCERADRIAAAVSVAGLSHPEGCQPSRPVPFAAYHGTDDSIVRFEGGRSDLQGDGDAFPAADGFFDQSMPVEFAEFAAAFGCRAEPEATRVGDQVVRYDYEDCEESVPMSFYEIDGGGHTWPGSPIGILLSGALGETTREVAATADGWAFMSRFALPDR